MATGYTRNDTTNNIANGNVINAADLDGEFDAIQAAYDVTTGHDHDGTVGGGAPIKALGPAQDIVITTSVIRPKTDNTVDLGTSTLEFKDLFLDGTAKVDTLTVDESATIAANLTVDTTTLVVDATNNRVGVGTASPSTTLHISSATPIITLTDTDNPHSATINTNSATGSLSISADTGNAVADSAIILNIDNTEKVRVLADGSVGIGTATPSATLDVVGGAEINGDLTVTGNTTLGNAATDTVTITADVASNLIPSADNTYDLGASGSEWKDLYIDGTANIDALVADAATIITSTGGVLTLQRDDTAITSGETLGEIDFQAPNVSGGGDAIVVAATIKAVAGDTFDAAVNKTSLLFQTASSGAVATRMEIDGNGNVAVDTDTLFVDAVNDRVGINNASPSVALDVTGAATISGILTASSDVSIADKIVHDGDTNTAIRFPAADTVTVETAGAERVRVTSAGLVGIGTSSPAEELHLQAAAPTLRLQDSDDNAYTNMIQNSGGFRIDVDPTAAGADSFFRVDVDGTERMRITSTGDVGIGTTSPTVRLDVRDSIAVVSGASDSIAYFSNEDTTSTATTRINLRSHQGDSVRERAYLEAGLEGVSGGYLSLWTRPTGSAITEKVRVTAAGNVGIGTSAPAYALDVQAATDPSIRVLSTGTASTDDSFLRVQIGGTTANSYVYLGDSADANVGYLRYDHASDFLVVAVNGSERMRITSAGNVGVGTGSTVSATLHVNSGLANLVGLFESTDAGATITLIDDATTGGSVAEHGLNTVGDELEVRAVETLAFETAATERMRITSAGNVGIGTSSPQTELEISGNNTTTSSVAASISGTTMTVTAVNSGSLAVNDRIHGIGVEWNTYITALGTGTGGTGTYTVNNTQTVSSTTLYGSPAGNNILRITNTDTSEQFGQTTGGIEFFGSDSSTPGAGVKGYIALVGEDTSPDYSMLFGTSNDTASTHAVERMRIDSDGNLLVGKTTAGTSVGAGVEASANGSLFATRDLPTAASDAVVFFNRETSTGDIIRLRYDGTTVGVLGVTSSGVNPFIGSGDVTLSFSAAGDTIVPAGTDGATRSGAIDLGNSANRWDTVFATVGTINTSDRTEKQDIEELNDAERRVAVACKGLLRKYRLKSAIAKKGEDARIHFGIIAQDLQDAFAAEGLDAGRYGMFIHSTWTDEETGEEKSLMGVRYSELLAFIIAAI